MLHEIQDGQLGALQAVGRDVARQHAARAIQDEEDVLAERVAHLRLLAPLRPGQGQADAGHGEHQQHVLEGAAGRAVGAGQLLDELRRGELRELPASRPGRVALQATNTSGASTASQSQRGSAKWGLAKFIAQPSDSRFFGRECSDPGLRTLSFPSRHPPEPGVGQSQLQGEQPERRQQRPLEQAAGRS